MHNRENSKNKMVHLSLVNARGTIEPEVNVTMVVEKRLQHIKHPRHLSENQDTMFACLKMPQQVVQCLQFPAIVLDKARIWELSHHARLDRVKHCR